MSSLDNDVSALENAMRSFAQSMKRPQRWAEVVSLSGVNLDRSAAMMLQAIIMHRPRLLRVQDLALHLGIESPSVTRKSKELEQAGYIRRTQDPNDHRAVSLEVTKAGLDVASRIWQVQRKVMSTALADWPIAERHQFVSLFERFSKSFSSASVSNTKLTSKKT